ncbi:hypothetical protein [Lentzea tibetensis]|uniref:hypothetical protein n=1 Tax=Lentzea tibetensis TaxID=2591470 RepID=UPI0016467749|nr:hypothetical protein [Lentzea tibetensis]
MAVRTGIGVAANTERPSLRTAARTSESWSAPRFAGRLPNDVFMLPMTPLRR